MENKKYYELLQTEELKKRLAQVDVNKNPQEAQYLGALIERGGNASAFNFQSAVITNRYFKWLLVSILSIFIFSGLLHLYLLLNPTALVSILVQSLILFLVVCEHKSMRVVVKIWSALLCINGLIGIYAINLSPDNFDLYDRIEIVFIAVLGASLFFLARNYIKLVDKPYFSRSKVSF